MTQFQAQWFKLGQNLDMFQSTVVNTEDNIQTQWFTVGT